MSKTMHCKVQLGHQSHCSAWPCERSSHSGYIQWVVGTGIWEPFTSSFDPGSAIFNCATPGKICRLREPWFYRQEMGYPLELIGHWGYYTIICKKALCTALAQRRHSHIQKFSTSLEYLFPICISFSSGSASSTGHTRTVYDNALMEAQIVFKN